MTAPAIKCLLTRKFWDQDLRYLRERVSPRIEFVVPDGYGPEALIRAAPGAEIFLGDVPDATVLDAARELRLIQIPWTGVDQVDFDSLRTRTFQICNSHSNSRSVAELGMALLLACLKQIPSHDAALRRGDWRRPGASNFVMPERLGGKTVGLLGFGAVGTNGPACSRALAWPCAPWHRPAGPKIPSKSWGPINWTACARNATSSW